MFASDPAKLVPPPAPAADRAPACEPLPDLAPGPAGTRVERLLVLRTESLRRIRRFHAAGGAGLSTARLLSEAADRTVQQLLAELAPGGVRGAALVALGGSGRRELSPASDWDLMLVHDGRRPAEIVAWARALTTALWDARVTLGWSLRTPAEILSSSGEDLSFRTALLDTRFVAGSRPAFERLEASVLQPLLARKPEDFVAAKLAELRARRERYGDSLFVLEPNIKEGEGGLRDLETALWVARARFRTRGLAGLLEAALLPASEVALARAARDFLLRTRHELHFLRGRKEDRLTFDLQQEVARFFGHRPSEDWLPVEQFMRDVYLSGQAIRRVTGALVARVAEGSRRGPFPPERRLGTFKVFRGALTVEGDGGLFRREPATVVRLFRIAEEEGLPLHSYAREQMALALPELSGARGDPAIVAELKALLGRADTRGAALEEMHALGVLGALVPEFGRVTARHQHDLYHLYTVDVHTLRAVRRLYALRAGDLVVEEPERSRAMRDLEDPLPLYLGMLLHDAGKGMGGDHSAKGRMLMEQLGGRLGLTARQREVAEFLVLHHLTMSQLAQRRDLSDPELIASFAQTCGDEERLVCLDLLTYADMCSVAPGVWNAWRAGLLRELFEKTRAQLRGGADAGRSPAGTARERFLATWTHRFGDAEAERLSSVLPERYLVSTPVDRAVLHARLLRGARSRPLAAALQRERGSDRAEIHLCAEDRPGLLALWTGVLAGHGIDILSARIASTRDGFALDVFSVRGPAARPVERTRWRRARADLRAAVQGGLQLQALLDRRRKPSVLRRPLPAVQPRVSVDNRASSRFTVVDVRAEDRPGLLHDLAAAFRDLGFEIALAKVATEANRAIDSFYVSERGTKVAEPTAVEALRRALEAALRSPDA